MGFIFAAYSTLVRHATREYKTAESDAELTAAKDIISRDIMMAGYGIADDYGDLNYDPRPVNVVNETSKNNFDILTLRGTAIGIFSRTAQAWSWMESANNTDVYEWDDARENITRNDMVIFVEPVTRKIFEKDGRVVFKYPKETPSSYEAGTLVYGIHSEKAKLPYYTVQYILGGTPPSICAPGTYNLLRAESKDSDPPSPSVRRPLLNCVLDFQVVLGLDTNENKNIYKWEPDKNGIFESDADDTKTFRHKLKQVRIYILVQKGNYDPDYIYENPDSGMPPDTVRVGSSVLEGYNEVTLSPEQRKYHWRVISLSVTPRNL